MAASAIGSQKTVEQIIAETAKKNTASRNTDGLGKDDFLNLLVTQLKYQDPLNPTDDKEFIGQMAQFSSLEQMQNMNNSMTQTHAYSLMGKHIKAVITDSTTKQSKGIEGDVTGVKMSDGKAYVEVKGQDVPVDKISEVTEGTRSQYSNLSQYTNIIGYQANGVVYDSSTGDIVPVSGAVKSVQSGAYEDYAVMDGVKVNIAGVVSDTPSTDPNFVKDYLKSNLNKAVSVYIKNNDDSRKVAVTGTLTKYDIGADGSISAEIDGLNVPVESISNITSNSQKSNEEQLLESILQKLSGTNGTGTGQ